MRIIALPPLKDFWKQYPDSEDALQNFIRIARQAEWRKLADIKVLYNDVDHVGNNRFVFNIRGNKYRLVVHINFNHQIIYIRFIGTHQEYNKIDCSTI